MALCANIFSACGALKNALPSGQCRTAQVGHPIQNAAPRRSVGGRAYPLRKLLLLCVGGLVCARTKCVLCRILVPMYRFLAHPCVLQWP